MNFFALLLIILQYYIDIIYCDLSIIVSTLPEILHADPNLETEGNGCRESSVYGQIETMDMNEIAGGENIEQKRENIKARVWGRHLDLRVSRRKKKIHKRDL